MTREAWLEVTDQIQIVKGKSCTISLAASMSESSLKGDSYKPLDEIGGRKSDTSRLLLQNG